MAGTMNKLAICISLVVFGFIFGHYTNMPEEHLLHPKKSIADAKFYNYSGYGSEMQTSDIIFTLVQSLGACDIIGKMEIKVNGSIGICTNLGWKVYQPDE